MAMFCTLKQDLMRLALLILSLGTFFATPLCATPLNNVFDTQPIYTPYGNDKFYTEKEKFKLRFHVSPFYQQTSTARDASGKKVPGGDRLGAWNMFGVFYGSDASSNSPTPPITSTNNVFTSTNNYPNVKAALLDVADATNPLLPSSVAAPTSTSPASRYRSGLTPQTLYDMNLRTIPGVGPFPSPVNTTVTVLNPGTPTATVQVPAVLPGSTFFGVAQNALNNAILVANPVATVPYAAANPMVGLPIDPSVQALISALTPASVAASNPALIEASITAINNAAMPSATWVTAEGDAVLTAAQVAAPVTGATVLTGPNLTNEDFFQPTIDTFAFLNVPTNYEKIGCRSQLSFDFGCGFGLAVKGGVVDVKNRPRAFTPADMQFILDAYTNLGFSPLPTFTGFTVGGAQAQADAGTIYSALFSNNQIYGIAKDLGISLATYHKASAEDTHVECYWNAPLDFTDAKGETAVTFIPRIGIGVWLPTGEEADPNVVFSVPTGNNGYYAGTFDASLGFDFPVLPKGHSLQFNFGGGLMFSSSKDVVNRRVQSSQFQSGLIPWTTTVSQKPGTTWHLDGSLMADGIVDGLAVFFDFMYTHHLADSITLKTTNSTQPNAFQNGLSRTIRETEWKNQQVNLGFNYKLAEALAIGGAVQAHISGVQVMRSVTVLGSVTLSF